jgi:hypothetical protein
MVTQPPPKPDPNTYWVAPGKLLAGEYPGAFDSEGARRRLRRFLSAGVRHFIDLTEAGELEPYAELLTEEGDLRTSYERIPIRDVSVPDEPKTMAEIIAAIDRAIAGGGVAYVHCRAESAVRDSPSHVGCRNAGRHPMRRYETSPINGIRAQNPSGSGVRLKPPSK